MSQRVFTQGNLEVFTGWDRPLQRFFLLIERQDASDEDEDQGYVFNNLRRANPGMSLEEIDAELQKARIDPPPTLFADLEEDRRLDRGNYRQGYYLVDGAWQKQ